MNNIIEELWNGEILPQENLTKDNPEYQELRHRQIKKQQELVKTLSDEQNEKFEDYCGSVLAASAVAALSAKGAALASIGATILSGLRYLPA